MLEKKATVRLAQSRKVQGQAQEQLGEGEALRMRHVCYMYCGKASAGSGRIKNVLRICGCRYCVCRFCVCGGCHAARAVLQALPHSIFAVRSTPAASVAPAAEAAAPATAAPALLPMLASARAGQVYLQASTGSKACAMHQARIQQCRQVAHLSSMLHARLCHGCRSGLSGWHQWRT